MFFDDFLISSLSGQNKKSGSNQGTSQSFKIQMISVFFVFAYDILTWSS